MRGEHILATIRLLHPAGSSPHARGTRNASRCAGTRPGIIPACAGNTVRLACCRGRIGDHPRMRGEHAVLSLFSIMIMGSSPHARGTPSSRRSWHGVEDSAARRWDHPRMRGEHRWRPHLMPERLGSSPHARGTPSQGIGAEGEGGIIPACAGNTA